jgi:hypothetical protein
MVVFLIFTFVNLYHLATTASLTLVSFAFTFFILSAATIILYFTAIFLIDVNWTQSLFGQTPLESFSDPF